LQTILNNLGLVAGLALGVIGIYVALRSRERKEPRVYIANDGKIGLSMDAPTELELLYHGKRIPTLTSTYVWFLNEGRRPIRRDDIAPRQPIRIQLTQDGLAVDILEVVVRKTTRESIAFKAIAAAQGAAELSFDFLDYRDGALVEILHTGPSWVKADVSGVILGCPKGISVTRSEARGELVSSIVFPLQRDWKQIRRRRVRQWIVTAAVICSLIPFFYYLLAAEREITTTRPILSTALKPFVTPTAMPAAVAAVVANDKWPFLNASARYLFWFLFLVMTTVLFALFARRTPSFPETLALRYEPESAPDPDEAESKPPAANGRENSAWWKP
jgi:hypothetical protein